MSTSWTTTSAGIYNWTDIESSDNGSTIIASTSGTGSNDGNIYVSGDSGSNWTSANLTGNWSKVSSNNNGSKMSAIDKFGNVKYYASSLWNNGTVLPSDNCWTAITYTNSTYYACMYGGCVYSSPDMIVWTKVTNSPTAKWTGITYDATKIYLCTSDGYMYSCILATTAWASYLHTGSPNFIGITCLSTTLFLCECGGYVYSSLTSSISTLTSFTNSYGYDWSGITTDGTSLFACTYGGYIYTFSSTTSTATLTNIYSGATRHVFIGITYLSSSLYVITKGSSQIYSKGMSNGDITSLANTSGYSWSSLCFGPSTTLIGCSTIGSTYIVSNISAQPVVTEGIKRKSLNWSGIAISGTTTTSFVCEYGGYIYTSSDQINYTVVPSSPIKNWTGLFYDGFTLFACTSDGYIYSYLSTWTQIYPSSGSGTKFFSGITKISSTLYVCENGGSIYSLSTSGSSFTTINTESKCYTGIIDNGTTLYCCTYDGYVYSCTISGTLTILGSQQVNNKYTGIAYKSSAPSSLYLCTSNENVYSMSLSGTLLPLSNITDHSWSGIRSKSNTIYLCTNMGKLFSTDVSVSTPVLTLSLNCNSLLFSGITYGDSKYYACVSGGNIYSSTDTKNWLITSFSSIKNWSDITFVTDGSNVKHVFLSTFSGEIWKSSSGGALSLFYSDNLRIITGLIGNSTNIYFCTNESGVLSKAISSAVGSAASVVALIGISGITISGATLYLCNNAGSIISTSTTGVSPTEIFYNQSNNNKITMSGSSVIYSSSGSLYQLSSRPSISSQYKLSGTYNSSSNFSGISMSSNTLFSCTTDGIIYSYNTNSSASLNLAAQFARLSGNPSISGIIATSTTQLYACTSDGKIYSVTSTTSSQLSTTASTTFTGITISGSTLFMCTNDGKLYSSGTSGPSSTTTTLINTQIPSLNYSGIVASTAQQLYMCVNNINTTNSGIYSASKTGSTWGVTRLSTIGKNYTGIYLRSGNLYMCTSGSDIWSCTTTGSLTTVYTSTINCKGLYVLSATEMYTVDSSVLWKLSVWQNTGVANTSGYKWSGLVSNGGATYGSTFNGDIYNTTSFAKQSTMSSNNLSALVSSYDGAILYASIFGGSIYKSTNGGATFSLLQNLPITNWTCVTTTQNSIVADDGRFIYAGINNKNIYKSTDGGSSWTLLSALSKYWTTIITDSTGNTIYACTNQGEIYRSTNGGSVFNLMYDAALWINDIKTNTLGTAIVASTKGGKIYVSTNTITPDIATRDSNRNWVGISMAKSATSNSYKSAGVVDGGYLYIGTACIMKGAKITMLLENVEIQIPIEELKVGDLVKTIKNGYKPIVDIITGSVENLTDVLKIKKNTINKKYPNADLFLTKNHGILLPRDQITRYKRHELKYDVQIEGLHKLLVKDCIRSRKVEEGELNSLDYYHIVIYDDKSDKFGIYANGLSVETMRPIKIN